MDPQLYRAVRSNDVATLGRLADTDNNILHQRTPSDKTVLHIAAESGHKAVVEEICRRCTTSLFTEVDSWGLSPLHVAARDGHFEIVEALIRCARMTPESSGSGNGQRKSKLQEMLEMETPEGQIALQLALTKGHLEVVRVFTEEEQDGQGVHTLILGYGVLYGHLKIVDFILERHPSFPICFDGPTPLHFAIIQGNLDMVYKLIKAIPDYATSIDCNGQTPLHIAARKGQLRTVQMLLEENRATVYVIDENGNSPIHMAALGGHVDVYLEFIQKFPDLGDMVNKSSETVLHMAVNNNNFEFVRYILNTTPHEEIINACDVDGNTALHLAVKKNLIWVIFLLLDDKRVNAHIPNEDEETPITIVSLRREWGLRFSKKAAIWFALIKASRCKPSLVLESPEDEQKDAKKQKLEKTWKNIANTLLVVAALITTVTFAAIFTLPGGYEDSGSDEGFAHFRKKTLFQVFLLLDALAMFGSMGAALLIIVANWTDYLGLKIVIPWALGMTSFSFISMSVAFSWALGLMTNYTWAFVLVSLLNVVLVLLTLVLFGFSPPVYLYWRVCVTLRRAKRAITHNCGIYSS